ncbi:MAG: hypothetical protein ACI8XO_000268 [Verrucomicrobiales bacterium]|jgi:hypothetical protein
MILAGSGKSGRPILYVIEGDVDGFGDIALVRPVLLVKRDRFLFLLTAKLEIGWPTGDEDLEFGDEFSWTPWLDLGNWWTQHAQFVSGNDWFGSAALIKIFGRGSHQRKLFCVHLEGLQSLLLEIGA